MLKLYNVSGTANSTDFWLLTPISLGGTSKLLLERDSSVIKIVEVEKEVSPKRWDIYNKLQGVKSHKTVILSSSSLKFVYCAVRTGSLYTASLTFSNCTFCPHCVFMCFVWN
jgi:hypothetical protein